MMASRRSSPPASHRRHGARSQPTEHRICVKLLAAYGALSAILLVSDLLSLAALLGQVNMLKYTLVTWGYRRHFKSIGAACPCSCNKHKDAQIVTVRISSSTHL